MEMKSQDVKPIEFSQPNLQDEKKPVYTIVEQMPTFPGGEGVLFTFVKKNIKYPKYEIENGIQGRVIVGFMIDTNGRVYDIAVKKGVSPGLDSAAVEVVSKFPNFTPGRHSGKVVRVAYVLPIMFKLPDEKVISLESEKAFSNTADVVLFREVSGSFNLCVKDLGKATSQDILVRFYLNKDFVIDGEQSKTDKNTYDSTSIRECMQRAFKTHISPKQKQFANQWYTVRYK
jgi:protein TonB